jgi:hypothetical protein
MNRYAAPKEFISLGEDIRPLETPEALARPTVFDPEGKRNLVEAQIKSLDVKFPKQAILEAIRADQLRLAEVNQELKTVNRQRQFTNKMKESETRERIANRPWPLVIAPFFLIMVSGAALCISIVVLKNYVVRSGASDLYASDPDGAWLFAAVVILAAVGIKVFERFLVSDFAKRCYRTAFFVTGLMAFLVWAAMAAIVFAPDGGSAHSLLALDAGSNAPGILLVFTHVLSDLSFGYLTFSGAEQIAFGHLRRKVVANPPYIALTRQRRALLAEVDAIRLKLARAQERVARIEAARDATGKGAEFAYEHAYAQWEQGEAGSVASRRERFLKGE